MKNKYYFSLDDCFEDLFTELEKVQDGDLSHKIMFEASSKEEAASIIGLKLIPFFTKRLEEEKQNGCEG